MGVGMIADVDAGVNGLSALDLRIPFGVEVPFVPWTVVELLDVWFTILCSVQNKGKRKEASRWPEGPERHK